MSSNEQRPKRINLSLIPSVRQGFENAAVSNGMSLTEFLRRAAFAAQDDPSILRRDVAEKAEQTYKANLGPSRWTRENE